MTMQKRVNTYHAADTRVIYKCNLSLLQRIVMWQFWKEDNDWWPVESQRKMQRCLVLHVFLEDGLCTQSVCHWPLYGQGGPFWFTWLVSGTTAIDKWIHHSPMSYDVSCKGERIKIVWFPIKCSPEHAGHFISLCLLLKLVKCIARWNYCIICSILLKKIITVFTKYMLSYFNRLNQDSKDIPCWTNH